MTNDGSAVEEIKARRIIATLLLLMLLPIYTALISATIFLIIFHITMYYLHFNIPPTVSFALWSLYTIKEYIGIAVGRTMKHPVFKEMQTISEYALREYPSAAPNGTIMQSAETPHDWRWKRDVIRRQLSRHAERLRAHTKRR